MDPDNAVVKLCAEGMQAEGEGRNDAARALFEQAWQSRSDDFEACIAAHYLARHQDSVEQTMQWNLLALQHADAVGDERVRGFYPSLYLNAGASFEHCGEPLEARRYYERAQASCAYLPAGPYGEMVRDGIARALLRVQADLTPPADSPA